MSPVESCDERACVEVMRVGEMTVGGVLESQKRVLKMLDRKDTSDHHLPHQHHFDTSLREHRTLIWLSKPWLSLLWCSFLLAARTGAGDGRTLVGPARARARPPPSFLDFRPFARRLREIA